MAILAGNHAEEGEDPGELIINDPEVIAVLKPSDFKNLRPQEPLESNQKNSKENKPKTKTVYSKEYTVFLSEMEKKYGKDIWSKMSDDEIGKADYLESHGIKKVPA